ncbi:MAG TPA: NAD(P)-dependent oxidoreductase [Candidatus Polarisedimenticolia bacterium]|nr:NAD(P)-dependent oxidoreductase [Candidatus Polarisedimenticolia bacterium]
MISAGFVGLGIMGRPMAGHLLRAGFPLTVFNRTRARAEAFAAEGARLAESPAEVARASEVVIVMVSDSPDVEAVVAGPGGVVEGVRRGAVVVDMGTVSPETERRMAELLRAKGADYVDAPVSGGDVGAKNATLAIMAGGNAAALEKALPVLERLGKSITHCGPVGSGQLTKLCNQILVGVTCLAVSEAISLARRGGLDPAIMIKAVENGAAASWQLSNLGPKIVSDDVAPGFMVDLIVKDLNILERTAKAAGAVLPATDLVKRLFESAQAHGEGRAGTQVLGRVVARLSEKPGRRS